MPEQYCNDLHTQSCSNHLLASTKMLSRLPVSKRCRFTVERSRRAPSPASCSGLTQQGLSPLSALHRATKSANVPQHALHTPVQRSQRPSQFRGRDVRAFIRAPVIPALETQPYREGDDKASQLQAGKHMYSQSGRLIDTCMLSLAAHLGCQLQQGSVHSSLMLHSEHDNELHVMCSAQSGADVAELVHDMATADSQYSKLSEA